MAHGTRHVQSADNRSILLELRRELDLTKDTYGAIEVQNKIDQIVAQNFLSYMVGTSKGK